MKLREMICEIELLPEFSKEKYRKRVIKLLETLPAIDLSCTISSTIIKVLRTSSTKPLPVSWNEVCFRRSLCEQADTLGVYLGVGKHIQEPILDINAGLEFIESHVPERPKYQKNRQEKNTSIKNKNMNYISPLRNALDFIKSMSVTIFWGHQ